MLFIADYENLSIHQYFKGERFTPNLHNNNITKKEYEIPVFVSTISWHNFYDINYIINEIEIKN